MQQHWADTRSTERIYFLFYIQRDIKSRRTSRTAIRYTA